MPIYKYSCNQCGKDFELLLPRCDAPAECPACRSSDLQKKNTTFAAKSSRSVSCKMADTCPGAGKSCGCSCGCAGHRH